MTNLFDAVRAKNLGQVTTMLEGATEPNLVDAAGWSPLLYAASTDQGEIIRVLCQYGADINYSETATIGWAAIHIAAFSNCLNAMAAIVEQPICHMDQQDRNGGTALLLATAKNHVSMVNMLLQAGAAVGVATIKGATPLTMAKDPQIKRMLTDAATIQNMAPRASMQLLLSSQPASFQGATMIPPPPPADEEQYSTTVSSPPRSRTASKAVTPYSSQLDSAASFPSMTDPFMMPSSNPEPMAMVVPARRYTIMKRTSAAVEAQPTYEAVASPVDDEPASPSAGASGAPTDLDRVALQLYDSEGMITLAQSMVYIDGAPELVKRGYMTKSAGLEKFKGWNERWLELFGTYELKYFTKRGDKQPAGIIDVSPNNVTAVQMYSGDQSILPEKVRTSIHAWEIVTLRRTFVFYGETRTEAKEWISALQEMLENPPPNIIKRAATMSKPPSEEASPPRPDIKHLFDADPHNNTCCDCQATNPRWASTSIGCFVCIACAGIHRLMPGTSLKSAVMDAWNADTIAFMLANGNTRVNAQYEANVPMGYTKPAALARREEREEYVFAKYKKLLFVANNRTPARSEQERSIALRETRRTRSNTVASGLIVNIGSLMVSVKAGRDLVAKDVGGKSDPFVVLELDDTKYKTKVKKATLNPAWDETFQFTVPRLSAVLKVTCWDWDLGKKDDFMGEAEIRIARDMDPDMWIPLRKTTKGYLHLQFRFGTF